MTEQKLNSRKKPNWAWLLFLLTLHLPCVFFAQSPSLEQFTTNDGIPSNEVYQVIQDKNDLLWFATDRGICNYDGYNFQSYSINDGLTSNVVYSMFPQRNGKILCSTQNNKYFFIEPSDRSIIPYAHNEISNTFSEDGIVTSLFIDKKGTLSVGFCDRIGKGVFDAAGKSQQTTDFHKKSKTRRLILEHIDDGIICYQSEDSLNSIRNASTVEIEHPEFGFFKGANYDNLDLISSKTHIRLFKNNLLIFEEKSGKQPISLGFIDKTHFWVGFYGGGIKKYQYIDGEVTVWQHTLKEYSISSFITDKQGGEWYTTLEKGVFHIPDNRIFFFETKSPVIDISNHQNKDTDDFLFSTKDGSFYHTRSQKILLKKSTPPNKSTAFSNFYNSKPLWTFNDSLYYNNRFIKTSAINKLSDEAPIGMVKHMMFYIHNDRVSEYPCIGRINDVCTLGDQWFISMYDGIYQYDTLLKVKTKCFKNTIINRIDDLDRLDENTLLAGSIGNGIYIIENGNIVQKITRADGLTSDYINEIIVENENCFWITTNNGINCLKRNRRGKFEIISTSNLSLLRDKNINDLFIGTKYIWLGGTSGLTKIDKSYLNAEKVTGLHLSFKSFWVNEKTQKNIKQLSWDQNNIRIQFQSISHRWKDQLIYRYRLADNEKWKFTNLRELTFEELLPGEYNLTIQGGIENQWNLQKISLPFTIIPHFTNTWWFFALVFIGTLILIALFFKYRVLVYNRDVLREILRHLLKRVKGKNKYLIFKENGKTIRVSTEDIHYIKSSGNYVEIYTSEKKMVVRGKISNFLELVPDKMEFLRIQRSFIVRIDKVKSISKDSLEVLDKKINVGNTYQVEFAKIAWHFK